MPLAKNIDPKNYFATKLVPGFERVGVPGLSNRVEQALAQNAPRALQFFAADIFSDPIMRKGATQVCRAIICIDFLTGTIGAEAVKSSFQTLLTAYKEGDESKAEKRAELVNKLARLPAAAPAPAATITQPIAPMMRIAEVVVPPVVLPTRVEARFRQVLRTRYAQKHLAGDMDTVLTLTSTGMKTAATRVLAEFSISMHHGRDNLHNLGDQVEAAYANFSAAYANTAKAENAKVELIKKIATAGLDKIPVIGGVLSGVAGGVIGAFKHDEGLLSSDHDRYSPDEGGQNAVAQFFSKANAAIKKKTTLGVTAEKMKPKNAFSNQLRASYIDAEKETLDRMRNYLNALFSDDKDSATQNKAALQRIVHASKPTLSNVAVLNATNDQIRRDAEALQKGFINQVNRYVIDNDGERMKRFVELTLWAEYFRALVGEAKFDGGFAQIKEVSFTLSDDVLLALTRLKIIMKKGDMKYAAVVEKGRLPFDGHPVHNIGLILFFQWYYKVNPFKVFVSNTFTSATLESHINTYIASIGKAIDASKDRSFFSRRTDIKDFSTIQNVQTAQIAKLSA